MARDWRRLAFAIVAAAAVGFACAASGAAQEPAKSPAKKTKAKAKAPESEEAEEGEEGAAKSAPKKKRQDPAEAQRAIEAALKLIEAGKAEPATQALSAVIAGGNLPPAMMAKALFYRGVAYRQQKMPAQAIADLTSALWLKGGLGGNDRADAMRQRTSAYQEAGLAESGEPLAPATVPNAPRAPTRTASVEQGWGSEASPSAPATKQSGSGWNPFAGWFGGSPPSASPPPPPAAATHAAGHCLDRPIRAFLRHATWSATHERMDAQHRGAHQQSAAGRRRKPAAGRRCKPAAGRRCQPRGGRQARGSVPHPGRNGAHRA